MFWSEERNEASRRRYAPVLLGAVAVFGCGLWWRKNPSACPYALRFFVDLPHPFITRRCLREVLDPEPGEKVLEVGPGTGYYALHAAGWLEPGGTLEILDLQQEMLNHVMRRARGRDVANIVPTRGDAQALPYPDGAFDDAYLTVVLGEIPDQIAALRELRREVRAPLTLAAGKRDGRHEVPGRVRWRCRRQGAYRAGAPAQIG